MKELRNYITVLLSENNLINNNEELITISNRECNKICKLISKLKSSEEKINAFNTIKKEYNDIHLILKEKIEYINLFKTCHLK